MHIGVVIMALGVVGMEFFQTQTQVTLQPGASLSFNGYTLHFDAIKETKTTDGRDVIAAILSVDTGTGRSLTLIPRADEYIVQQQTVTVPGNWSTLAGDLYVVLTDWQPIALGSSATFRVFYNPLIIWLWLGAVVLIAGGLFAFWPDQKYERRGQSV